VGGVDSSPIGATTAARSPERGGRFRQVDSIRGLACISVLFYHVAFRYYPPNDQLMQYLTQRNSGPPAICLVVFFTISGFVIYRPFVVARWQDKPMPALLPYATRRVMRIVPAYWLALTVAGVWFSLDYLWHPVGFLRYYFFAQLYANHTIINGGIPVAWSLGVEMTYYLSLPGLAWLARRLGRSGRLSRIQSELAVLALMVIVAESYQLIVLKSMNPNDLTILSVLCFLPGCLALFAGGMLLAVLNVEAEHRAEPPRWWTIINRFPWLPWIGAAGAIYAEGQINGDIGLTKWWMSTLILKPIGAVLLLTPFVFGQPDRGWLRKLFGWAPLVWIGTVSYAFYLWHYQILLKLEAHLIPHTGGVYLSNDRFNEAWVTVLMIALSLVAGALSWYLWEKPLQKLAARWLRSRAARQRAQAAARASDAPVAPA
jgi:peptidoglycan/LPS O-acetylase OafA/YrhL